MKLITVRYMGFTAMDRRFSSAMLPWIVSEIRKRDSKEQVSLGAEDGTLQAYNTDFELQFSHRIQNISRFSQGDTDPCSFLYLVTDDSDRLLYCYMFQATVAQDVSDLYQQMRDQGATSPNLTSLCGDISPSSSHFFEVLYVGKIRVSHRRVPETFIDDALEKFKSHELARRASYDSTASNDSTSTTSEVHPIIPQQTQTTPGDETDHPIMPTVIGTVEVSVARKDAIHDHNRTMVLQVGRTDMRLISPDRKQVLLHRYHRDVVVCVQGTKNPEHFGFVCKEQHQNQPQQQHQMQQVQSSYVGYVFKCESSSVASDAVGAVSQAASAPASSMRHNSTPSSNSGGSGSGALSPSSSSWYGSTVTTCEHCPMVWYHRLCTDIEGLGDRKTQATIFRRIEHLDDDEQASILTKFRGAETDSTRDQNEFLMMLLRAHCEMKQNRHVHDTAENRSEFLSHYLGGGGQASGNTGSGTIFMKAKRSLSSSFEHLLKRKGSRDDFGSHIPPRELSLPVGPVLVRESSPTTPTSTASDTPITEKSTIGRQRSATIGSHEFSSALSPERSNSVGPKSPMMDIFMKVGNSPRSGGMSSGGSTSDEASPRNRNTNPNGGSWRQAIFNRVVTPNKNGTVGRNCGRVNPHGTQNNDAAENGTENARREPRTSEELRALWKRAIKQAVLLVRMEKENARLRARQEESAIKRIKLEYDEMSSHSNRASLPLWDMLAGGGGSKADHRVLLSSAGHGVPAARRGEVWQRLADLYCSIRPPFDSTGFPNYDVPYEQLLKQLTAHQHAILIDLGRTFPNHPYYKSPLGPGQLSLFNLLKAYSLLDPEVGYCQGLSFVAGVLLLHMDEPDAFRALRHLMFRRGLRAHYLPDMAALQVRLYQLSRLLHDRQPDLYVHLDVHEVAPTLYAAPWLLTLFASQFPLGFVARVFDVLFVDGADAIFRVAMALLSYHSDALLACDSFEQIMDYLKCRLPDVDATTLDKVMTDALSASANVTSRLNEYRVEYQVLQEEANSTRPQLDELARLRDENRALLERNNALQAQLEMSMSNVQRLERNRTLQQSAINRLEVQARTLEVSVVTLGTFIDSLVEQRVDVEIPGDVRRIVAQLMVNERRRNDQRPANSHQLMKTISNSAQLFKRDESENGSSGATSPSRELPRAMVKSLSTGRINTHLSPAVLSTIAGGTGTESAPRSVSLQSASDLERDLRLGKTFEGPVRSFSNQNLGAKVSNFFSNTHNHILRQHRSHNGSSPPPSPPHISRIIREESREDMSPTDERPSLESSISINNNNNETKCIIDDANLNINPTNDSANREKISSLPLREQTDSSIKINETSPSDSVDSGVGTPMTSPPGDPDDISPAADTVIHPLSGCDVSFTFNGTTKLKNIRSIRNLSRNSSPDLLGK